MFALRNYTRQTLRKSAIVSHYRPAPIPPLQRTFFIMVSQYEKGLLFKSGRYVGEKQPGFRLYIPLFHEVSSIDMRTQAMQIPSQELMTRDNVTIHVDAVAFFKITDAFKSATAVQDCQNAISEVAQASLRGQLSRATFNEVLHDREEAGKNILVALNNITNSWGVNVDAVKLKNISIDRSMIRAMSRRAEAERVREARLIEASAEFESSKKLVEAAKEFEKAPLGLRLRELQTFAQIGAEKNTILIPANFDAGAAQALVALYRKEQIKARLGKEGKVPDDLAEWDQELGGTASNETRSQQAEGGNA
ncbi:MAG: hypothetical protein Q9166_006374 [cf. Caloplaca sp. 2 TL-2023]